MYDFLIDLVYPLLSKVSSMNQPIYSPPNSDIQVRRVREQARPEQEALDTLAKRRAAPFAGLTIRIRQYRSPIEILTLTMLLLTTLSFGVGHLLGRPTLEAAFIHFGLLLACVLYQAISRRWLQPQKVGAWAEHIQYGGMLAFLLSLYFTLSTAPSALITRQTDVWLAALDTSLFSPWLGQAPVFWMEDQISANLTLLLSIAYAAFIPYLHLSLASRFLHRKSPHLEAFASGLAAVYSLGYIGYLFFPAYGPIIFQAQEFQQPLPANSVLDLVINSIDAAGGPHGALPSLHVAVSTFLCAVDWQHGRRLRSLIFSPLVVLILFATVYLRYHYAVDVFAGLAVAAFGLGVSHLFLEPAAPTTHSETLSTSQSITSSANHLPETQ